MFAIGKSWYRRHMKMVGEWKMPAWQKYQMVQQSSDDEVDEKDGPSLSEEVGGVQFPRPPRKAELSRKSIIIILAGVLSSVVAAIVLTIAIRRSHVKKEPDYEVYRTSRLGLSCGSSAREALTRDCTFDILTYSWTPNACLETTTSREFEEYVHSPHLQFGAFPFFYDAQATIRVPNINALSLVAGVGNSSVFASHEIHLAHCIHMARRVARIAHGQGGIFTEKDGELSHQLHCTDILLEKLGNLKSGDDGALHTVTLMSFNTC